MIKTFKVKHNTDFSKEIEKAKAIAEFTLKNHCTSSAQVKQFGLKSIIANQIIRKITQNKKIKRIRRVNLIIPNQGLSYQKDFIWIPSLKLKLPFPIKGFTKINQIEINSKYCFVSCSFSEASMLKPNGYLGVDLNTTGHMAVLADPQTGKVWKLNKKSNHIRNKYRAIRRKFQKNKLFKQVKKLKDREHRICKDLNHKITTFIVRKAKELNKGIRLENLKNIRNTAKTNHAFKAALHSWSFYQFRQMIDYKAKLLGVKVEYIDPRYTSQADSKTGLLGQRKGKIFKTANNAVEHADVNAAFNIALNHLNIVQLRTERDVCKRCGRSTKTDSPQKAISNKG